jgi:hypothetical protein
LEESENEDGIGADLRWTARVGEFQSRQKYILGEEGIEDIVTREGEASSTFSIYSHRSRLSAVRLGELVWDG